MDAPQQRALDAHAKLVVALFAVLAAACEPRFVEPTPPELSVEQLVLAPTQHAEPVVYAAILDLHVPDRALCDATRERVRTVLRGAAAAAGAPTLELGWYDLSPECTQLAGRSLPVDLLDAGVQGAQAAFPAAVIRPLLVYVNNVELAVPFPVASSLEELRDRARGRGAPAPLEWGLVLPAATRSHSFDVTLAWTHATDETMWTGLARRLAADLPLQTRADLERVARIGDPSRALLLKVCRVERLVVEGCTTDGRPCPVTSEAPLARASFAPAVAQPRSAAGLPSASVVFESCGARCERFLDRDGRLDRWSETAGCAGGGA